jgi:hypothetical protein
MAIDVVVLDCSGVIFLWLLGSLEILPAPQSCPDILVTNTTLRVLLNLCQRAGSAGENLLIKDYFLPFSLPSLRHPSPTFLTFVRFFLFISLCALGSIIAIVPLKQFYGRRVHSLFYSITLSCAGALDLGPWVPAFVVHSPQGFLRTQHSRSALDII